MGRSFKLRQAVLVQLIEKHRGNVSAILQACPGLSRSTLYYRMAREPKLKAAMEEAREATIDACEKKFLEMCFAGNVPCLLHFMRTKAAKRGYRENVQVTISETDKNVTDLSVEELERLVALPSVTPTYQD